MLYACIIVLWHATAAMYKEGSCMLSMHHAVRKNVSLYVCHVVMRSDKHHTNLKPIISNNMPEASELFICGVIHPRFVMDMFCTRRCSSVGHNIYQGVEARALQIAMPSYQQPKIFSCECIIQSQGFALHHYHSPISHHSIAARWQPEVNLSQRSLGPELSLDG